jgi:hypothetical protein
MCDLDVYIYVYQNDL